MSQGSTRQVTEAGFSPPSAKYGRMLPPVLSGPIHADDTPLCKLALRMIDIAGKRKIDNEMLPAAYTYFGQFIDHDLTLDLVSTFETEIDVSATRNFRTAALELDSVYGLGPHGSPYFYQRGSRDHFRLGAVSDVIGSGDPHFDLPRLEDGTAVIAEPRNDENLFVNQLHVAFLRPHNRLVELETGGDWHERFEAAKQQLRWHYQWVVLYDYLPKIVGSNLIEDILSKGRRLYDPLDQADEAYLPVEFSAAAFRFGHSQIRGSYRINRFDAGSQGISTFPAPGSTVGEELQDSRYARPSLQGGPVRGRDVIEWSFLIGDSGNRQNSMRIGPLLSEPLRFLPTNVLRDTTRLNLLSARNLLRGARLRLPNGKAAAQFAADLISDNNIRVLDDAQLWSAPFEGSRLEAVPLWFYILREAEVHGCEGRRLAGLGARIVAEVIIGVLQKDAQSILGRRTDFVPRDEFKLNGFFNLEALLRAAEMPFG